MEKNPSLILSEEHKIIQSMIGILKNSINHVKNIKKENSSFFDVVIDFFRIFADEGHHEKEEFVFFKKLKTKPILDQEKKLLNELIEEHKIGRTLVRDLEQLKDSNNFIEIEKILKKLVDLYVKHIEKENIRFFPPAFKYFSEDEKKGMALEFYDIDHHLFYKKYSEIVKGLKKTNKS